MWKDIKNILDCFTERQVYAIVLMILIGIVLYFECPKYLFFWGFIFIVYIWTTINFYRMFNR